LKYENTHYLLSRETTKHLGNSFQRQRKSFASHFGILKAGVLLFCYLIDSLGELNNNLIMDKQIFTVKILKNQGKGKNLMVAKVLSGPKKGHCFSRQNISEFNLDLFWRAMELHFGGRCFCN